MWYNGHMSRADIYRLGFKLEAQNKELKDYIVRADAEYAKAQEEIEQLKKEKQESHDEIVAIVLTMLKKK